MGFMRFMGTAILTTKRYSPQIKFIAGCFAFAGALYTTHKAALKSQDILEKKKKSLEAIEEVKQMVVNEDIAPEDYTEEDEKVDRRKVTAEYIVDMGKNYALPALCTAGSIWLFHGAVMDYKNLFVGLGAAYNAINAKYNDKMKFLKEELGEEKFNDLEEGFKTKQVIRAQSTGLKDPKAKSEIRSKENPYSRWFDELHPEWTENPEANKTWLQGKENMLNERLHRLGHLFLNDVYEEMGFEPTDAGRVMGWIAKNPDGTRNYIDFGIFNIHDAASRWFVNGLEPIFLIDFNVDEKPITGRIGWATY